MPRKHHRRGEKGQAIALVAIMMIGLIAFVGLALDGGHFYDQRRIAQNAVDSATSAAAHYKCWGLDPIAKSKELLKANGFDPADPRVTFTIEALPYNPNTPVPTGTVSYTDYQGTLTVVMNTYFLPIIRIETLTTTVKAVARCIDKRMALEKATLAALSTSCQWAMNLSGSGINVEGSTFSNNDLKADASAGGGTIGEGFYLANLQTNGVTWTNEPEQISRPITDPGLFKAENYAPGSANALAAGEVYHFVDGDLNVNFNTADLPDGLYFVTGSFKSVGSMDHSHRITIVAGGSISLSATDINLTPFVDNLLLFSQEATNCGTDAISLSSKLTVWNGIIYAPNGGFTFSDSGNSSTDGGIMAQTIDIHSSSTQIMRNPGVSMLLPARTYLVQ